MFLLIQDINGCLCKKRSGGKPAILRPHVRQYLMQLLQWQRDNLCRVAFWTTMTERNALVIVNQLLTKQEQAELLFIWTADKCTPHPEIPFKSYKDLAHVWASYPTFNSTNTILFDDSDFKAMKQPKNIHKIKTFVPDAEHSAQDDELLKNLQFISENCL